MQNRDKQGDELPFGKRDRSQQRTVVVYTAHDEIDANLVKQLLHSVGIECVVHGRLVSGLYPGFIGDLGKRDILVVEEDVEDARELLAGWESAGGEASDDAEGSPR